MIGGAAVTEEIAPGFRASIFSYLMSLLHPRIIRDFELRAHGLEVLPCSRHGLARSGATTTSCSPTTWRRRRRASPGSRKHDAEIYPAFDAYLQRIAEIVRKLLWETPVDPTKRDWRAMKDTASARCGAIGRVGRKIYRIVDLLTHVAPTTSCANGSRTTRIKAVLRLLRLDRHLRRPEDAGLGLRDHAPPHGRA